MENHTDKVISFRRVTYETGRAGEAKSGGHPPFQSKAWWNITILQALISLGRMFHQAGS